MEYSFSAIRFDLEEKEMKDEFGFGFKHRGTWWAVENLDRDSGLFDELVENDLIKIRKYLEDTGLPPWHPPRKEGFFRHFVIRKSYLSNKLLIGFVTSGSHLEEFDFEAFVNFLLSLWGDRIEGIIHVLNDSVGDFVNATEGNTRMLYGEPKIVEELLGLKFEISLQSFFQPNPKCAEKLYQKAIDYAMKVDSGDGVIMDLFCGTGTISQLVARHSGKEVIGVDIVEEAIEDARMNAQRNEISDIHFYAANAGKFLREYPEYQGKISTVIMDPPRAGIAPKTLQKVINLQAPNIVYISCNPATQARDAEQLNLAGYELKKFSLVDQFPHTSHLESVMLFSNSMNNE
jgi:23S rRNA (uracil-5-)-methyltransferase RumA